MKIEKELAAALVIDYQEKLIPAMSEKERVVENSSVLLAGLRTIGVPLIVTQQYTKGLGMTIADIQEAAGTKEYVEKIRFGAYQDVQMQHPEIRKKRFLILCGVEAHICVLQTVIDCREAGYIPVLVTDCVTSRKQSDVQMAIERAKQEGALLTTYEALLFELLQEAGTETSKKIQRLIK